LSYGHAQKIEAQLEAEVKELFQRAAAADQEPLPAGLNIPEELTRRTERLAAIRKAKAEIEARAAERDVQAQAEYEMTMKARAEKTARTGKKPGGKPPAPPSTGVRPTDQINLTDPDSRIMPGPGKSFEQSYNAQAAVDTESMLVVATTLTQAANDKQQVAPMLAVLASLPAALGTAEQLLADNGYFSAANVEHCVAAKITPLLAAGRDGHHPHWAERFSEPPALPASACAVEQMKHRLQTGAGRQLYALRKQTVEPVFGIIKAAMGFRQFLLRGLAAVSGEWTLVTMAWNIKRMAVMVG
jgi:IS5 family transposase